MRLQLGVVVSVAIFLLGLVLAGGRVGIMTRRVKQRQDLIDAMSKSPRPNEVEVLRTQIEQDNDILEIQRINFIRRRRRVLIWVRAKEIRQSGKGSPPQQRFARLYMAFGPIILLLTPVAGVVLAAGDWITLTWVRVAVLVVSLLLLPIAAVLSVPMLPHSIPYLIYSTDHALRPWITWARPEHIDHSDAERLRELESLEEGTEWFAEWRDRRRRRRLTRLLDKLYARMLGWD